MKHKTYILLLIALLFAAKSRAEDIVYTEDFQSYTPISEYYNQTPEEYVGTWTTWSVTNGCVTNITAVADAFGGVSEYQKAVALQYNGNSDVLRGTMTSGYIKGRLKKMSCKLASNNGTARGAWFYSEDNNTWNVLQEFLYGFNQKSVSSSNIAIPEEVKSLKGVYLRLEIISGNTNARVYVDDIHLVVEQVEECENCFSITL